MESNKSPHSSNHEKETAKKQAEPSNIKQINQVHMKQLQDLETKIIEIKRNHEKDIQEVVQVNRRYTVDFFKTKAAALELKLSEESNDIYEAFVKVREAYFDERMLVDQLIARSSRQERIITSLKTSTQFILQEIFQKVESFSHDTRKEAISYLPAEIQNSSAARENPIYLYLGYLDHRSKIELS